MKSSYCLDNQSFCNIFCVGLFLFVCLSASSIWTMRLARHGNQVQLSVALTGTLKSSKKLFKIWSQSLGRTGNWQLFLKEESLLSWWDVTYLTLWSKIWLELVSRLTLINAVTSWLTFVFSSSWRIHFSAADMSYAKAGSYHQVPRDFNVLIQTCSANIQKVTQNSKKTAFPAASSLIMSWIWDIIGALYCDTFILLNITRQQHLSWKFDIIQIVHLCLFI